MGIPCVLAGILHVTKKKRYQGSWGKWFYIGLCKQVVPYPKSGVKISREWLWLVITAMLINCNLLSRIYKEYRYKLRAASVRQYSLSCMCALKCRLGAGFRRCNYFGQKKKVLPMYREDFDIFCFPRSRSYFFFFAAFFFLGAAFFAAFLAAFFLVAMFLNFNG